MTSQFVNTATASIVAALALLAAPAVVMADPPAAPAPQSAPEAAQDVATLLFGNPQWGTAPVGSIITYSYSKKTANPTLGDAFDDTIKLTLEKGDDADSRVIDVQMFSGVHAHAAGPFPSEQQNPVLLLVFEANVQEFAKLFKGNPLYLKSAIRNAWRSNAKIEKTSIDIGGKSVPGTRISVTPFVGDAEAGNMLGLDGIVYTVEIADSVPGQIANIDIHAPATGTPKFSETLHFQSITKP